MIEALRDYFAICFSFAGVIDYVTFIVALAVLFYNAKFNLKNALILLGHLAGMYVALLFFGAVFFLISKIDIFRNYMPKLIVMILYACFFGNYKWQTRVILCAMIYALNHCFIEVGGCLSGVIDVEVPKASTYYIRSLSPLCTIGVAVPLRLYNMENIRNVSTSVVAEICLFSCVGVFLAVLRSVFIPYFGKFEQTEYWEYSFYAHLYIMLILLSVIIFLLSCYFFLVWIAKARQENEELNKKAMRQENIRAMIALNEENLKRTIKLKHEIKNRYFIMQGMLKEKRYREMETYFEEINNEAIVPLSRVNTGNGFFDMAFNLEIAKAEAKNVEVTTKLIVPPELPISDSDMGGLITNLMDNAIEACEKIKEAPRSIDVNVQVVHSYLILKISNTISEEKTETALLLKTDKEDKNLHGFGSEIINDIVEKYDGQILRKVENNLFTVDIMLDIAEK